MSTSGHEGFYSLHVFSSSSSLNFTRIPKDRKNSRSKSWVLNNNGRMGKLQKGYLMKANRQLVLTIAALLATANFAFAQDASDAPQKTEVVSTGSPAWTPLPKVKTSKREQQIIDKVTKTIKTQFDSIQSSFGQLDKDKNQKLDSSEISQLLKRAKIKGLTRVIATSRLLARYDRTDDDFVDWQEYEFAVNKAIEKAAERAREIASAKKKPTPSSKTE